ncbi:MAG TPA: tRNA (adenosine(37)-N6)-threonylcarbamoyltransferase complex transferase subunit TsaD, partial [Planctomycetia bacterium]|nr:tRNA (adenosine(37)-N6)-threonylcarbamoyltransferase complex transferase subunit TsaD [Planctomycetia bacterium]
FTAEPRVLSSAVASQAQLHAKFGGVVPEVASRAHLQRLLPVIQEALDGAKTTFEELDAIAVCNRPGLVGSILVGLSAAKALAWTFGKPLLGVNHLEGHVYACQMQRAESVFPCIALVASGGHTHLFRCQTPRDLELVGCTLDDAAGEAFDKVASMLGLGYPGGPAIEAAAKGGDPKAYDFPRTFLRDERLDFSFSGLKTAVRYALFGQNAQNADRPLSPAEVANAAASFQAAAVEVLVGKCEQALLRFHLKKLCVGGGVAANGAFRAALEKMAAKRHIDLTVPPLAWCTDNAAMAAVAVERFRAGEFDPLDLDAIPGVLRP